MKSTTTRRDVLRGATVAAAASFAAVPAIASAIPTGASSPDALVDLERQFARNEPRFNRACAQLDNAEMTAWDAGLRVRTPTMTVGYGPCMSVEEVRAHAIEAGFSRQRTAELMREFGRRLADVRRQRVIAGLPPLEAEWDAAWGEHDRLLAAIARTPAVSAAGLAVKARFMARDRREGPSTYADELAASTIADAERLGGESHA